MKGLKETWLFLGAIWIFLLHKVSCQCTFPTSLIGTWVSSNDGTWVINSTHILNFYTLSSTTGNPVASGVTQLDFTCHENRGDTKYAIQSEEFNLFGGQRSVHTCIDIREVSENKLVYYHATEADPVGNQFTINPVYDNICNLASYEQPYNYHVALKSGTETTALQNCPSTMFGSYNYDTCSDVNSNDTSLDVCDSRQQLIFNYTLCDTQQMYTLEGQLDCVYHIDSGSISYVTLYNRDSTAPDNSNYFRYVCLAVELSGSTVYVTASPNRCNDNQNATKIDSPGQALQLTPYFLCPITTEEKSSFNILPIVIGVIAALLLLALIALIIYCCCRRKCRKKKRDEEEAKSDSEDEEEQKKPDSKPESRRSSKTSVEEDEEEKKSLDSGISEPPITGRTDSNIDDTDGDTKEEERELVINAEGDKEIDDKNSRPCSGQRSRMSDLPPSTIPPEEDQPLSHRSEEDQISEENKNEIDENKGQDDNFPEQNDEQDKMSEKNENSDHEPDDTEQNHDNNNDDNKGEPNETDQERNEESEIEKETTDEEKEAEKGVSDKEEQEQNKTEDDNKEQIKGEKDEMNEEDEKVEKEDENPEEKQADQGDNDEGEHQKDVEEQHQSDLEITIDNKGDTEPVPPGDDDAAPEDQGQTKENEEQESQKESDGEEREATERKNKTLSSDEDERQRQLIGGKKGKDYLTKGALTTVLVSREEEERKRQKLNSKSKKQKMRKMAKKKTRRFGGKGDKSNRHMMDDDDGFGSSDDDVRRRGLREAPFMKQYEDKKHIEHILDEQHYWSDPEADKDGFRIDDDMSSIFRSDYSSESEEEIIGTDVDGKPVRIKKKKRDKGKKGGDWDDMGNPDSEYLRQKMLKRAGSVDSMVSVEDPNTIDQRKSKRRLNEHVMKTDSDEEMVGNKNKSKTDATRDYGDANDDQRQETDMDTINDINSNAKIDDNANTKFSRSKAKTITVKEKTDVTEDSTSDERFRTKTSKDASYGKENGDFSELCDSDFDRFSEGDSGMDDEEGDVDVFLTPDQQQLIVCTLFDEEMNLRPQFRRDENGRIVRRLDDTVVYDPHTGRFTYRKRLGQIFKVPRLKRNDKGRPLGGYIEDEFGPKNVSVRRMTSSARKSQSGKSGQFSADTRSSSADLKRARVDGKNVGFSVPDEEVDNMPDDELEYNKRGRRDIGSAIRRTLNKRLFRKKRKLVGRGSSVILPEVRVKKAWTEDQHFRPGLGSANGPGGPGGVSPLTSKGGRFAHSSPWPQRKTPGAGDAEQWQMYREGLQSDRRILENLQDKLNTKDGPFGPREAFVEHGEEEGDQHDHGDGYVHERGYSYLTDDGRLVIRERGCPELKQPPLFTIVRRPGDLESQEHINIVPPSQRQSNSAPLQVQDYNEELTDNEKKGSQRYTSDTSLVARSHDGRYSQMTSIDDNRLRRLLEELYKDKKYFDNYIESKDPKSNEFIHSQGLAEHGRGFLLQRADFWERRGPLPPRPPMTDIGWKMQRQQTLFASRQTSELGISTTTCTPDLSANYMPGAVESPRNETINEENESKDSPNESFV